MTSQQILIGLGLTVVLAVAAQVLATRLRIPAIIVLLPVGFTAGAITDNIHPDDLLGPAYPPLVSLAVGVVLYDAGLGLDLAKLVGHDRRTVIRLVWIGVLLTSVIAALAAVPLLDISAEAAAMLGAILVVSGPTVVGPLLGYVRPKERLQRILMWEGSLIDAVGGILGALVFHVLLNERRHGLGAWLLEFLASTAIGLAGGLLGAALLWWLLVRLELGEILGTTAQLAVVIGVAAACDTARDDTGLIAAVVMGVAVASVPEFDLPARRPFFEALVSLIVGVLFISISATVTWTSLRPVVLPALGLVAVLVLVARPLVAGLSTLGTDLARPERAFLGWMAPRGIVAASTAATFSTELAIGGIDGAARILPVTFVVIVATVTLYGLSAGPVARRLGVMRPARSRPLLVGGDPWAVELGQVLRSTGLDVLMWAARADQRDRISAAGLELAVGELLATATGEGAEQESVTAVFLLTGEDEFNALACAVLREDTELPVFQLAPAEPGEGVVAPGRDGSVLFGRRLTGEAVARRFAAGARLTARPAGESVPPGHEALFLVDPAGRLTPVTADRRPPTGGEDGLYVLLGPDHRD
ncbi:cation:proton antiporter [Kitasatospora azatica]|uniref:cation:proton antiporter n=1 Tax=Kitasatospora azatica TaxID=58347 RepID=UPI000560EB96|nr:cation:proton antiporter [Kitasatospora azatica]